MTNIEGDKETTREGDSTTNRDRNIERDEDRVNQTLGRTCREPPFGARL